MQPLTSADRDAVDRLYSTLGAPRVRYCPLTPTPRQEAFLLLDQYEVFFGGAAAGGKTAALLMSSLQYADVPGYDALIVRRSLAELRLPGNLIELSHEWLGPTKAVWSGDQNMWRFPGRGRSGAGGPRLSFGYLSDDDDLARYYGSSFSYLGFDELTGFPEHHYRRMMRVLRQPVALDPGLPAPDGTRLGDVPVRIRSASNPGSKYHAWVKERFVDPETRPAGAVFLPSRLVDNPHIPDTYAATLAELPPAERERLVHGNWDVPDDGELFRREWLKIVEPHEVPSGTTKVRYWDLAATEPSAVNRDPDWTVGLLLGLDYATGVFFVTDVVRERLAPGAVERLVRATAERDGRAVPIAIEQEGGGAGKALTASYTRAVLRGFIVRSDRVTGDKYLRAQPVAAAAENDLVRVVRGRHTRAFVDEVVSFPHGRHDDCVDALSAAHRLLSKPRGQSRLSRPKARIPGVDSRADIVPHRISHRAETIQQTAFRLGARVDNSRNRRIPDGA